MNLSLYVVLAFLGLAIVTFGWFGWQLLRQNGRILLRLDELEKRLDELEFGGAEEPEGLPLGSEAPAFELPDLAGESRSLAQFRGQPVLLIFFHPDCGFCREMLPKLATLSSGSRRGDEADGPEVNETGVRLLTSSATLRQPVPLVITTGDAETNRRLFAEHQIGCPVLLQKNGEVAQAYHANGTPSGYLIGPDGKIASRLAMGAEELLKLADAGFPLPPSLSPEGGEGVRRTGEGEPQAVANRFANRSLARSRLKRDGLKAGTPAPDFTLPRLDGRGDLSLSELRSQRVLLVFSSPSCGPCNSLAPELEKFHRSQRPLTPALSPSDGERVADRPGEGKVTVVMISKGEPKENRVKVKEHGLTFPIVLQQQWEISRRYAMFATPVAYLINEAGVIHHDVAVGTDAIRELMFERALRVQGQPV